MKAALNVATESFVEKEFDWSYILKRPASKAMAIGVFMVVLDQFSGCCAMTYYTAEVCILIFVSRIFQKTSIFFALSRFLYRFSNYRDQIWLKTNRPLSWVQFNCLDHLRRLTLLIELDERLWKIPPSVAKIARLIRLFCLVFICSINNRNGSGFNHARCLHNVKIMAIWSRSSQLDSGGWFFIRHFYCILGDHDVTFHGDCWNYARESQRLRHVLLHDAWLVFCVYRH